MGTSAERLASLSRGRSRRNASPQMRNQIEKDLDKQLNAILKKLDKMPEAIGVTPKGRQVTKTKRVRSALRASAKKFIPALKSNTPLGNKKHYRYRRKKNSENGEKERITYHPGNLRNSHRVMRFKKASPLNIFVGPYTDRGDTDVYGINKFDPYYADIVHDGDSPYHRKNEFMVKAYNSTRTAAMQDLKKRIENIFRYHARQIKAGKI